VLLAADGWAGWGLAGQGASCMCDRARGRWWATRLLHEYPGCNLKMRTNLTGNVVDGGVCGEGGLVQGGNSSTQERRLVVGSARIWYAGVKMVSWCKLLAGPQTLQCEFARRAGALEQPWGHSCVCAAERNG
jgi:hypothetical protein